MTKKEKIIYLFSLSPYIGVLLGLYIFKNAFLAIAIYHIGIITAIYIYRNDLDLKTLVKINKPLLFAAFIIVYSTAGIVLFYLWDFIKLPNIDLTSTLSCFGLDKNNLWIFLIYFSTLNPIHEELFWRITAKSDNKIVSMYDVLYAAYHALVIVFFINIIFTILIVIGLIIVSRIWRFLYDKYSEGPTIIISHALADFSILLAIMILAK